MGGVVGSVSSFMAESLWNSSAESLGNIGPSEESTISRDRLREAPVSEVRRRFREETSVSSKGFGRVVQGSEETARSLDSSGLES